MKKIDLHLHLDGSVLVSTAEDILKMDNLKDKMISTNDNSLEEIPSKKKQKLAELKVCDFVFINI